MPASPALETMGYAFVTLVASQGDLGAVDGVLMLRGLMSPAAHMAWTGLTCAALWGAAVSHHRGRGLLVLLASLALAMGLHAAWDGFGTAVAYAVIAVISLVLLILTAWRLGRDQQSSARASHSLTDSDALG